jgi:hypothetical protein
LFRGYQVKKRAAQKGGKKREIKRKLKRKPGNAGSARAPKAR